MNIVCYIGSSNNNINMIEKLVQEGMTMGRFCFSTEEAKTKSLIEEIQKRNLSLKILQDLESNKFRVSPLINDIFTYKEEDTVCFCEENSCKYLKETHPNTKIVPLMFEMKNFDFNNILNIKIDGNVFEIIEKHSTYVKTKSLQRGFVVSYQGVEIIRNDGVSYNHIGLTDKDKADILWCIEHDVNILCLSYCDNKERIFELKKFIKDNLPTNKSFPTIYGKIETIDGVNNYDEILENVDGIMIGRTDLSSEIPLEEIYEIEKELVKKANEQGKYIVIASCVLGSMVNNTEPTSKEVSAIDKELTYGIFDYMLSKEVGMGKYPIETIRTLKSILNDPKRNKLYC